jgi:hypothetical protein
MELEVIMLSKISQTQKDAYYMFSLLCGILKNEDDLKVEGRLIGKGRKREEH